MSPGVIQTVLQQIEFVGYRLRAETTSQWTRIIAVDTRTSERFSVKVEIGNEYVAACQLARLVGIRGLPGNGHMHVGPPARDSAAH